MYDQSCQRGCVQGGPGQYEHFEFCRAVRVHVPCSCCICACASQAQQLMWECGPAKWRTVGVQVEVVAAGLSGKEGAADFLYYPAMPGNCTARPAEKWALQVRLCQALHLGTTKSPVTSSRNAQDAVSRCCAGSRRRLLKLLDLIKSSCLPRCYAQCRLRRCAQRLGGARSASAAP